MATQGMPPVDHEFLFESADASANLSNHNLQFVDIFHVPSGFAVNFKAMMTKFDDTYTANWESEPVYGRMDSLMTYSNTQRKINLGFTVVAGSAKEAKNNLERISALVQFLYPSYDAPGLIKGSPFCKLQFMNWAAGARGKKNFSSAQQTGLLGAIDGFSFSPDLDAGVFQDASMKIYPKILEVSFGFQVIHNHKLGWSNKIFRAGSRFPYLTDTKTSVFDNQEDRTTFPPYSAPVSKAQSDAVPIDEKKLNYALALTENCKTDVQYDYNQGKAVCLSEAEYLAMKQRQAAKPPSKKDDD
jgi:hypothetical protein